MKFRIEEVTGEQVAAKVGKDLVPRLPRLDEDERVILILYRWHRERGVTLSPAAKRGVEKLPARDGRRVLAVARDFTREACDYLVSEGVEVVRLSEFGWTDATYRNIIAR
jgi:hypothetical protein